MRRTALDRCPAALSRGRSGRMAVAVAGGLALALALSSALPLPAQAARPPAPLRASASLWPVAVEVELLLAVGDGDFVPVSEPIVTVVPQGRRIDVSSDVRVPVGRDRVAVEVRAHEHAAGTMELEWSVDITGARYERQGPWAYALHRLGLDRPTLGAPRLRLARADLERTDGNWEQTFELHGYRYKLRIVARRDNPALAFAPRPMQGARS